MKRLFFNNWFFPNAGPDIRFNPFGLFGLMARVSSFKSDKPPTWVHVERGEFTWSGHVHADDGTPFEGYVKRGWYWKPRPYYVSQTVHQDAYVAGPDDWRGGVVSIFRVGWRFDPNWPGYLFGSAWKWRSETEPMDRGY